MTTAGDTKVGFLQRTFLVFILLLIFWLTFGRALFGSSGWGTLIIIFTLAPFLLVVSIVTTIIIASRRKKSGYTFSIFMKVAVVTLLVSGFVFGFTLVDGGDTASSLGSVFTHMLGLSGESDRETSLWALGNTLSSISWLVGAVSLLAVFILSIIDGKIGKKK